MKIIFVINDITGQGGAERVLINLVNELIKISYIKITILSVFKKRKNSIGFRLDERVKIEYLTKNDKGYSNKVHKYFILFAMMNSFFKKNEFNNVVFLSSSLLLFYFISCLKLFFKKNKANLISWIHTEYCDLSKKQIFIQRILFPHIHSVVTLKKIDELMFSKYLNNAITIQNVNLLTDSNFSKNTSKKIIAVGRLVKEKGFDMLITSFSLVHKEHPEWKLDIYGEGDLFNDLNNQIEGLGLSEVIVLRGFELDIHKKYKEASIFALSSRTEGFPSVLIEAMSTGLSVVSFNLPGFDEIIQDENYGLLIEVNNIDMFAKGLIKLIENKPLRLKIGENAIKSVQKFRGDNIVPKWLDLFNKIEN